VDCPWQKKGEKIVGWIEIRHFDVEDNEIIVIGGIAVLGQSPSASKALLRSMEAHVYSKNKRQLGNLIDF
jgi:hypothetical protein